MKINNAELPLAAPQVISIGQDLNDWELINFD
jgi:hypothetical protein